MGHAPGDWGRLLALRLRGVCLLSRKPTRPVWPGLRGILAHVKLVQFTAVADSCERAGRGGVAPRAWLLTQSACWPELYHINGTPPPAMQCAVPWLCTWHAGGATGRAPRLSPAGPSIQLGAAVVSRLCAAQPRSRAPPTHVLHHARRRTRRGRPGLSPRRDSSSAPPSRWPTKAPCKQNDIHLEIIF